MLKSTYIDRTFAVVLGLGAAVGHTYGSLTTYAHQPMTLLWALDASALGALLGGLHLLRSFRPGDRSLALCLAPATLFWLGSAVQFGLLIGRPLDPRVLLFVGSSLGLVAFSLRTGLRPGGRGFAATAA